MKFIILAAATLMITNFASAKERDAVCSNAFGNLTIIDSGGPEHSEIEIHTITIGGPQVIKLKLADINLVTHSSKVLETSAINTDTGCGIPQQIKETLSLEKVTFSKKDGSEIISDDTPSSSPKSMSATVLCHDKVIAPWPCK